MVKTKKRDKTMNEVVLIRRYFNGERYFQDANLFYADFEGENLQGVDLRNAYLENASFQNADLQGVNLKGADLECANLQGANLKGADLCNAYLENASFQNADLQGVNLKGVNLKGADLECANLQGTKGLLDAKEWMDKTFIKNDKGYIVYKAFYCMYTPPSYWEIEKGSTIKEHVDNNRRDACSYGINFATQDWIEREFKSKVIWKCLLKFEDMEDLCVPYTTDGKARCAKLTLLNKI
jgi:hypothetical protein